jgi:alpha-L-rhamnosidase
MHRTVAGIAPLEPGYGKVLLAPRPGGDLTWAAASLETRHGLVSIRWERSADELVVETTLPAGVTGVLSLPDGSSRDLGPGTTVVGG